MPPLQRWILCAVRAIKVKTEAIDIQHLWPFRVYILTTGNVKISLFKPSPLHFSANVTNEKDISYEFTVFRYGCNITRIHAHSNMTNPADINTICS